MEKIIALLGLILAIVTLQWARKKEISPEVVEPTSVKEIGLSELYNLLKKKYPEAEIYLSDRNYLLCAYDDVTLFLERDKTNKAKYVVDKHDCDDFAYRLMGQFSIPKWSQLAFGLIWTNTHALNCFVDEDNRLWLIEPQTDEVQTRLKAWQGAKVRFIIM